MHRKTVFQWWVKMDVVKYGFLNNCKTLFVFGKRKKGIFINIICFGKMVFCCLCIKTQNTKKLGLRQAHGKPKNHHFFERGVWKGSVKGIFSICDPQKLCSAENTILIAFHKLQRIVCKLQKVTNNSGLCFSIQKGVFKPSFFGYFVWFWFQVFLCF